jgi:uncharacterized repeat protein (TIGR01451 family)
MKLDGKSEQAYVLADLSAYQVMPAKQSSSQLDAEVEYDGTVGTADAGDSEDNAVEQTSFDERMSPIPREDCPEASDQGTPLPYQAYSPWSPDAIAQPWPRDEYVRDGGDYHTPAGVTRDWQVHGLELEDTIAHYDTVSGKRIVEPSNEVYIYTPRFGAVRQVVGLVQDQQAEAAGGVSRNLALSAPSHTQKIGSTTKQLQPGNAISARLTHQYAMKQGDGAISTAVGPRSFQDFFKVYENLSVIRSGKFEGSEALRLAKSAEAAVSWDETQIVQAIVNLQGPMTAAKDEKVESVYRIEFEGKPALRLIKVASTAFANPGEDVWFTLRFDNIGNEVIGNVTLLDNLSPRLEYVPDSAQCSREANIVIEPNSSGSSVIRCELKDPLEATQGGVLRFRCKVR